MRQSFEFGVEVTLLLMEETCSVGDKILKVPELWLIHCRIIDLSDDAIPKSEPDSARSRIRSSYSVFAPMSPSGLHARLPESRVVVSWFHIALPRARSFAIRPLLSMVLSTSIRKTTSLGVSFFCYQCFLRARLGIVPFLVTGNDRSASIGAQVFGSYSCTG